MKTLRQLCLAGLITLLALPVFSQTDSVTNNNLDAKSFLRVGLQIPMAQLSDQPYFHADLTYEQVLSKRLTISANLNVPIRLGRDFYADVAEFRGGGFLYYDIRAGLNLNIKYYFSKHKYSGHYVSLVAQNIVAMTRTALSPEFNIFGTPYTSQIKSLPQLGLYYGYRKQTKTGLFFEGQIGVVPVGLGKDLSFVSGSNLDVNLSFGYTIPFKKKKKRKK